MNNLKLNYAEFYITNFCNFNCRGCNRFNNLVFTGQQDWNDYKQIYQQWSEILDLKQFTIIGGEPMTNPTYLEWFKGVSELWPDARGSITTNGHYLQPDNRELYEIIKNSNGKLHLEIGLHNSNRQKPMLETVSNWLVGPLTIQRWPKDIRMMPDIDLNWQRSYNAIKDVTWPDCNTIDDWEKLPEFIKIECEKTHQVSPDLLADQLLGFEIIDVNGVRVQIENEDFFHQGALILNQTQRIQLHNSNFLAAHDICHSKTCHHFDKGLLYKCGQVALFKELDEQFYLELSDADHELIYSYEAGNIENLDKLSEFINNLDQPLPQCKFCPESYNNQQIFAEHGKKIKFHRKKHV